MNAIKSSSAQAPRPSLPKMAFQCSQFPCPSNMLTDCLKLGSNMLRKPGASMQTPGILAPCGSMSNDNSPAHEARDPKLKGPDYGELALPRQKKLQILSKVNDLARTNTNNSALFRGLFMCPTGIPLCEHTFVYIYVYVYKENTPATLLQLNPQCTPCVPHVQVAMTCLGIQIFYSGTNR